VLPDDPSAAARRRTVVATAVVVVLLLGAVTVKLTTMQVAQLLGERAWDAGDPVAADRRFEVAGRLNVAERWIAPYNRGVAAYGQGAWGDAGDRFEEALDLAPESARCRVALNWTWSLEAAGDELAAGGFDQDATTAWNAAAGVLEDVEECTDGSAATAEQQEHEETRQRLESKAPGASGFDPPPGPGEGTAEEQAQQLDQRNREAAENRQRLEDQGRTDGEGPTDGTERTW
jgi:tetratricopeptide (TPR) repeat protein